MKRWLLKKHRQITAYLRWKVVICLIGNTLMIWHDKKYPADYVTIVDKEHRIPYGVWKFDGTTLIRIAPK